MRSVQSQDAAWLPHSCPDSHLNATEPIV